MALDVAMGGSTNTILHLLAAAHVAGVDFGLKEIDELSRRVPCLCKVAPSSSYHVEDVHRAGGIPSILGELDRTGLLNRGVRTVHDSSLDEFLEAWDLGSASVGDEAVELYHGAPGGVRTTRPYSQSARWDTLDTDRVHRCIRDAAHAYTADGGLAVLYGNLAPDGAIVKTAGVPEELWHFSGPAVVFESRCCTARSARRSRRVGRYGTNDPPVMAGYKNAWSRAQSGGTENSGLLREQEAAKIANPPSESRPAS